jgi:isopenicillin-N epimerase
MAANRALALEARDLLVAALGGPSPVPDALMGSMAAVRIPTLHTDHEAASLHEELFDEDRIEVPIVPFPVPGARPRPTDPPTSVLVRVSAQRYNDSDDIDRLVAALGGRLSAA